MSTEKLRQQFKGQLYKYTNVVKGWQYRWFILDPETGILDYYVNDSQRKQRPRGSVHLAGAVISPSDEDSSTFTVNSASGEVFKLQAADARERQEWVNRLRVVAEMHTMAIAQSNPPLPPREHHSVLPLTHTAALPTAQGPRVHCSLAVLDAFQTASAHLQKAEQSTKNLAQMIDNLPTSGPVTNLDPDLLMVKATSQATIACLTHCLSILQQQQIDASAVRSNTQQVLPGVPKRISQVPHLPPENADRKSMSGSDSHLKNQMSAESLKCHNFFLPNTELEISDCESDDEQGPSASEEHNMLLRLASITKRGMDLTKMVLPTFLMEPRSLLEVLANFWGHSNLFTEISDKPTAQDRMLAVVKWYLTSLHLGLNFQPAKKPLNPKLGETFSCSWRVSNDPSVLLRYVSEQVSHHPPVSAVYVECDEKKMCLSGTLGMRSIFTGMAVDVSMTGGLSLVLGEHNESYDLTLPTAHARSIISKPWVQLGGKVTISCASSGFTATATHQKSFFGEKPHHVLGDIKDSSGAVVCRFLGDWKTHFKFTFADGSVQTLDVLEQAVMKKRVRRVEDQLSFESRNLWAGVSSALRRGNVALAEECRKSVTVYHVIPTFFHSTPEQSRWVYNNPLVTL